MYYNMKKSASKSIFVIIALVIITAFRSGEKEFSGRISYRNTFTSLQGTDLAAQLAPFFGMEQLYYISDGNYKAYNEKKQLIQLYTGATNQYQYFKDGQLVQTFDAANPGSKEVTITQLAETATVAGYACKAVQILADGVTTVYFYAPSLRVKPETYAKHNLGDWYTYLRATQGGLTLKYVMTNPKQGFIMTSEATSVQPMKLNPADFTAAAVAK